MLWAPQTRRETAACICRGICWRATGAFYGTATRRSAAAIFSLPSLVRPQPHGHRLLRCAGRYFGHLRYRGWRTVYFAQRRQSRAALRARGQISRHERGDRVCGAGAESAASYRARTFALRRCCRLPAEGTGQGARARLHRQLAHLLDDLKIDASEIFEFGDETAFEFAAIRSSLANLRTFPFIKKSHKEGLLTLHGLHFDLASGSLLALDEAKGGFTELDAA